MTLAKDGECKFSGVDVVLLEGGVGFFLSVELFELQTITTKHSVM